MSEEEIIQKVWALFEKILGPKYRLFLFGSRAEKKNTPYSDFDFYVTGESPIPKENWQNFCTAIEEIETLYKIDLVDFLSASEDFKKIASKSAKEILHGKIRSKN